MKQLYLDLDGVFADFDAQVRILLGAFPWELEDADMWHRLSQVKWFYRKLTLMPAAMPMYRQLEHHAPIFISGLPLAIGEMAFAAQDKTLWVTQHFGYSARLITCMSRDKWNFCRTGDVLLDDRDHYAAKWRGAGGVFVHHKPKEMDASIQAVHAAMRP